MIWMRYGDGDLSKCKTRGIFKVGFKEFHTKQYSNAVSVFYPMDQDVFDSKKPYEKEKFWLSYKKADKYIKNYILAA